MPTAAVPFAPTTAFAPELGPLEAPKAPPPVPPPFFASAAFLLTVPPLVARRWPAAGAESVRRCRFNLVFSPPPGTAEPGRPARPALRPFEPLSLGFGVCARAFEVGLVGLELFCDGRVGRRPACGDALRAS